MVQAPELERRARPTTGRRGGIRLALLALPASVSASPAVDELTFLQQALSSPVVTAHLQATDARIAADGTHPALFANPSVQGRHEEARGVAGATTDAITASWTLDLGFPGPAEGQAASLRAEAGPSLRRAQVIDTVCMLRRSALDLWAASERLTAMQQGHERLDRLLLHLEERAEAGDASPYEVERTRATDTVHRAHQDVALVQTEEIRSRLEGMTGTLWQQVELLPMPSDPASDRMPQDPLLAALQTEVTAAEQSLVAARRAAVPDMLIFGGARWDAPPGSGDRRQGWEVGAALSMPFFERNQVGIATAHARLTEVEAELDRRAAEVDARVLAARRRLDALQPLPPPVDGPRLWAGALSRFAAGESSIDDLLWTAETVTAARVARTEAEALRRAARLDLACSLGSFEEPALQALVEEALR